MRVPGRHLGVNSAAAVLTALKLDIPIASIVEALGLFPGVRRRFELKGTVGGVRVYDEYAYHPTSMTAALTTLREVAGDGRLIVAFQPYRMYRTRDLQTEIATALAIADEAVVLEVFGPGEARGPGEGGAALTAAIELPAEAKVFVPEWDEVPAEVVRRARPGDVVVTMGAPPISLMGDELLDALGDPSASPPASTAPSSGSGSSAGSGSSGGGSGSAPGPAPAGYQGRHIRPDASGAVEPAGTSG
jgi:UDP-N-acetylmuramate--alanine ligase